MKLYHGTSEPNLEIILKQGIIPRKVRKDQRGNWKHSIKSNPDAVYLTNAYAVFYAQAAVQKGERLAVLEIDTSLLFPWRLTPDEDFLEQASRKQRVKDDKGGVCTPEMSMKQRTMWYRRRLLQFAHMWEKSLEGLGNCCYHETVPVKAIRRYATLPTASPISFATDPCMTLLNYAIMGGYYRELTKHVFGEPMDLSQETVGFHREYLSKLTRDDVEVKELQS